MTRDPRHPFGVYPDPDLDPDPDPGSPFLRPKTRTRVRRPRRGWSGRTVLALQVTAVLLLAAASAWAGYARLMKAERLRVARVDVRGSRYLSEGEVRELLGPSVGENILTLDIEELNRRLRASPWVADATVRRTLPDTVHVLIHERVPLALAEVERLYLMDADGVLIDIYGPHTAGFDLPIVRGLRGLDEESRAQRAKRAGFLLSDLGELAEEVSEVVVEPGGSLRVVLRTGGDVLRLGRPPYRARFLTFLGLRESLRERCPTAQYFDLRFKQRIYAKQCSPGVSPAVASAAGGR